MFPAEGNGVPADKENFVSLLKVCLLRETNVQNYRILNTQFSCSWLCHINLKKYLWNLRCTQWCIRGFVSSGIWVFVIGLVAPDILKALWSFVVAKPLNQWYIADNICSWCSIIVCHSVHNTEHWLQELREEFDKYGWLLMAQLGVLPHRIEHSYDVPAVSQYLHYMLTLCHGYTDWNSDTGPNAPLYPSSVGDNHNVVRIHQVYCRLV
jgi:hypothetical protein